MPARPAEPELVEPELLETDVVVVGSGVAGATAALAAAGAGARVELLEKTPLFGGTTAVSAGALWVPGHGLAGGERRDEELARAAAYVRRLAGGACDEDLLAAFLADASDAAAFLEAATPLRLEPLGELPDYHPELPGASAGGRSLDPGLFDTGALGVWAERLRRSPIFGFAPMSLAETFAWRPASEPAALPFETLAERSSEGLVGYGTALAGGLLAGLLAAGVVPRTATPVRELWVEEGRVAGVVAERTAGEGASATLRVRARHGVVLASGGFEWDAGLVARHLGAPLTQPGSPPAAEGDGLRLGMRLGADLSGISQAAWCPSTAIPGETYDGRPLYRGDFTLRSLPHSLIVDRSGRRFVNEALGYHDLGRVLATFHSAAGEWPHLPAWLVLDGEFLARYALPGRLPEEPPPDWLTCADDLAGLAAAIGVDAQALAATVERFNGFARAGVDADFGRGASAHDRFSGDRRHGANPCLGELARPPFAAIPLALGTLGTRGGLRVDGEARVLSVDGRPIPGLYAAGNVAGVLAEAGYPGGGWTLGLGMTFGRLAGGAAASGGAAREQTRRSPVPSASTA